MICSQAEQDYHVCEYCLVYGKVLIGTLSAASINIFLNVLLIPVFKEKAAAFTTCVAEAVSLGFGYFHARRIIRIKLKVRDVASVILGCIAIIVVCICISYFGRENIGLVLGTAIPASVFIYVGILIIFKNEYAVKFFTVYYTERKSKIRKNRWVFQKLT